MNIGKEDANRPREGSRVAGSLFRPFSGISWLGPALLTGAFIVVVGTLLWLMQNRTFEKQKISLARHAMRARESVHFNLNSNQDYLMLLAREMARGSLDADTFQERVSQYVADHPELINVVWADADFVIRWTAPYEPNKQVIGLILSLPEPERASHEARDTRRPVYTEPFVVIQGQPAFEIYVPIFRGEEFLGTFGGIYSIERVLRYTVAPSIADEHQLSITGESGNIIAELSGATRVNERLVQTVSLSPPGYGVSLRLAQYETGLGWGLISLSLLSVGLALGMGWGMWALSHDITERKRAEEALKEAYKELQVAQEQLIRREKLAVLGQLAGGVGHELRNPLGVISNAVYFLQMTLPDADETTATAREYLEMISAEVRNSTKIISDLLDFSRTRMPDREEAAVSELVAEVLEKRPPPEGVQATTQIAPDLPPVYVDPQQMGQVLGNLVTNAYQAMPEGGKLTISAQAEEGQVALSVADTGCGISEENMAKLFEPLFTTKARGIGLGLATSRSLVEANGGSIEVASEEGKGSTFTVKLPLKEF